MNIVKITPREPVDGQPTRTQGTEVWLADGTKLEGVTRIELTAEVNDIWRAKIDVVVTAVQLEGVLAVIVANTFKAQGEAEVTGLEDDSRRFAIGQIEA